MAGTWLLAFTTFKATCTKGDNMSLFLQSIEKIAFLARKADVRGTPRISISFDNEADEARFLREINHAYPVDTHTNFL